MATLKIQFKHFNGTKADWERNSGLLHLYDNDVVFAKIWDITLTPSVCNYVIYAGKDENGAEYKYDMASLKELVEVEKQVKDILNLVDIDSTGKFTNDNFKEAIENYIKYGSATIQDMQEAIDALDISINQINTVLEQAIHWMDENGKWIEE